MALGIRQNNTYPESTVRLQSGDRLLFYTDGTTDARRGADFFGVNRLKTFLVDRVSEAPNEFTGHLVKRLLDFSDGHLHDDVAIMLICAG
jgi:serine phosphatase RsbU (regulator of sigma subunit)